MMVEVAVYENKGTILENDRYAKAIKWFEKHDIAYSTRVAWRSTGEQVVEATIPLKQAKKLSKYLGRERMKFIF